MTPAVEEDDVSFDADAFDEEEREAERARERRRVAKRAGERRRYERKWELLLSRYGRVCACCGKSGEDATLSIHHVDGRDYEVDRIGGEHRLNGYLDEAGWDPEAETWGPPRARLEVRCLVCNGSDGARRLADIRRRVEAARRRRARGRRR